MLESWFTTKECRLMLTEIIKGFQALSTPAEKIEYIQRVSKAGGFNGYNINATALIKAWSKYL